MQASMLSWESSVQRGVQEDPGVQQGGSCATEVRCARGQWCATGHECATDGAAGSGRAMRCATGNRCARACNRNHTLIPTQGTEGACAREWLLVRGSHACARPASGCERARPACACAKAPCTRVHTFLIPFPHRPLCTYTSLAHALLHTHTHPLNTHIPCTRAPRMCPCAHTRPCTLTLSHVHLYPWPLHTHSSLARAPPLSACHFHTPCTLTALAHLHSLHTCTSPRAHASLAHASLRVLTFLAHSPPP